MSQSQPAAQFNVVWIHARGDSLQSIVVTNSDDYTLLPGQPKPPRVFTEKPATQASVIAHILANKMLRAKANISYWVNSGVDVFYSPLALDSKGEPMKQNIAADALMLQLSPSMALLPSDIQPHGLCLCVAAGVIPEDLSAPVPESCVPAPVTKQTILKILAFTGQLGTVQGDAKKMNLVKHHWKWYDPSKGDKIDAAKGKMERNGKDISTMVSTGGGADDVAKPGVTYPEDMITTTPSGLKYVTVREGLGARKPTEGTVVKAHYCGWLGGFEMPTKFDSSRDKGKEFSFQVGVGDVIKGWDEAIGDMKKRERRMIIVPPELGYGQEGAGGGIIPPMATLYFDVELISF